MNHQPSEERRPGAGVPRFIETPKGFKTARNWMLRFYFEEDQSDDAMRHAIGENLELVYMPPVNQYKDGLACFIDADGIKKGLSENPRAAGLFPGLNPILGRMTICGWDRHEDLLLDCPELIFEMAQEEDPRK